MMGRPPLEENRNRQVGVRLPRALFDRLEELRRKNGLTMTQIIVDRLCKSVGVKTAREKLDEKENMR